MNLFSNKLLPLLLLFGLFLVSCASKRLAINGENPPIKLKKRSTNYLLKQLKVNELEAEWLSAKARITFKDIDQTRKFTANIRIRKDSVIWMNVKKVNVEAARILVTKDSIYIINRLDKEYYVKGLDFVEERFNLPGQFQALQTAILGNPFFFDQQKLKAGITNQQYQLSSGRETRMLSDYFINGISYALEQMSFLDLERDRKLKVFLEEYLPVGEEFMFAHNRNFFIDSEETGEVEVKMKFSKVEINVPKTIRFSISDRYTRVDE